VNVAREMISQILLSQDLQPYLDAGFDGTWLKSPEARSFILNSSKIDDWRIYEYLLEHHAKHGCVPSMDLLRDNFPTFRLSEETYKPSEIIEKAHTIVQRHNLTRLINEAAEWSESDDFSGVPHLLREHADRFSQISSGPGPANSWQPVDLKPYLTGEYEPLEPTICRRADEQALLYRGKTHSLSSETEGGKTWLALYACAQEIAAGNKVLYLDFEDGADGVTERLCELVEVPGSVTDSITGQFRYIRPEGPLIDPEPLMELAEDSTLVIIDGITEAMTMHGLNPLDNADVAKFNNLIPNPLATRGPAVLSLDHVVKDKNSRGRYQIGAVHKLNAISGVSYVLLNEEPFGRGRTGKSRLLVSKDRPGHVRQHGTPEEDQPALTFVAQMIVDNQDRETATEVHLTPPAEYGEWRPTHLMARASKLLAAGDEEYSKSTLASRMGGNAKNAKDAINFLVTDGYAKVDIRGRTHFLVHVRTYEKPNEFDL
jgi:hypothetical protein